MLLSQVSGLAMLLQKKDPYCMQVTPMTITSKITVSYIITGMNEDQVNFSVSNLSVRRRI